MTTSDHEIHISELHETKEHDKFSEGWLVQGIKAFEPFSSDTYSQAPASVFARSSKCSFIKERKIVEVGAHVTRGTKLWIVTTCKAHHGKGALDRLGGGARLKKCTIYIEVALPKDKMIKEEGGKFYLDKEIDPADFLLVQLICLRRLKKRRK